MDAHPDFGYGRQFFIDGYLPENVTDNPAFSITDKWGRVVLSIVFDMVAETTTITSELNFVSCMKDSHRINVNCSCSSRTCPRRTL